MKLYNYWRSSASYRVRLALHSKGLDFEYVPVHLLRDGGEQHQPAYRERNPLRQVPLLVLEDGKEIAQSMAILEYLEEVHPEPPLLPEDPVERAKARQIAEMINAGIQPLHNLSVTQHLQSLGVDGKEWTVHWIARGLEAVEAVVRRSAGTYCVGDRPSFADVCLIPQLYSARRFGVDVEVYPTLLRVEAACQELLAFQAAAPDKQPDAA